MRLHGVGHRDVHRLVLGRLGRPLPGRRGEQRILRPHTRGPPHTRRSSQKLDRLGWRPDSHSLGRGLQRLHPRVARRSELSLRLTTADAARRRAARGRGGAATHPELYSFVELLEHLRVFLEEIEQILFGQHEQLTVRHGLDVGRTRAAHQAANLAKIGALDERFDAHALVGHDRRAALHNKVHEVGFVATFDDFLALRHRARLHHQDQVGAEFGRLVPQEGDLVDVRPLDVAHDL
mmetsp:Transcript_41572/g.96103  ORF Transcript_41572/g.96103 Transcript_41572/m.96103 type:complete len:236 (-) Transcript_41572:2064-2771(-)